MHGNSNSPDAPRFMSGSWTRSMLRQKEEWCRWWKERAVTMVDNQIIFLSIIPFSSSAWLSFCLSAFPLLFCYLLISQAGKKNWQSIYFSSILLKSNAVVEIYGKCQQLSFVFSVSSYTRYIVTTARSIISSNKTQLTGNVSVVFFCSVTVLLKPFNSQNVNWTVNEQQSNKYCAG